MTAKGARAAIAYFGGDELCADVFLNKYALRDLQGQRQEDDPDQMHRRLAREFARIEKGKFAQPLSEDFIYELFKDFGYIIPQGSPMYGVGSPQYVSISNCFVVDSPEDSYGGIHWSDQQLTQICKRRGGVGMDLSRLRPEGFPTTNSSRKSSGVVAFMRRFSNSTREVGQDGRRGALMLTLSVHHPQVLDFARAKLDNTEITGANISIRLSDEFLQAVRDNTDYEQRWPVEGAPPRMSRRVPAKTVWQEIIRCAWQSAEPGLLFWDQILRESPADCYARFGFRTVSTNPCSELPLCVLDSCRLLLLNLFAFVRHPFSSKAWFDLADFAAKARLAQRLMDDLVDLEVEAVERILAKIESDPEPAYCKAVELQLWQRILSRCQQGRRTGTGITALGDVLAAVGIRYGSAESIAFTEEIYRTLKLNCYQSSVDMARELGPFPLWQHELEKDCPFLLRIRQENPALWEDMKRHGRRNIALLTTAPAGSVSIVAGPRPYFQTTSGIEPLFKEYFVRRRKVNATDHESRVDFVDALGDRWQEYRVYHPKLRLWMEVTGQSDISQSPYHGCCAEDLQWVCRVQLQAVANRHVDHAISSTLNVPETITPEEVGAIYQAAWEAGCKGVTVYRAGCRQGVLVEEKKGVPRTQAPKRPRELPAELQTVKVSGQEYFVLVGFLEGDPYEVFAGKADKLLCQRRFSGTIRKVRRGHYDLWGDREVVCEQVNQHCDHDQEALTRMVSTALRHGSDVAFVVGQLEKVRGDMSSFARALARVLKKYIKDGTPVVGTSCPQCFSENLVRSGGCATCHQCGWSACS